MRKWRIEVAQMGRTYRLVAFCADDEVSGRVKYLCEHEHRSEAAARQCAQARQAALAFEFLPEPA